MHENFIALEKNKRDRIINSAMKEFAAKGFTNASTNEIVKKAEISKGALFHYFSTKQDLVEFLCRYCVDFMIKSLEPCLSSMSSDIFERFKSISLLKIEIASQYPDMANFVQVIFNEETPCVKGVLMDEYKKIQQGWLAKVFEGVDFFKFRPDIDIKKSTSIIWWVFEGFALSRKIEPVDYTKPEKSEMLKTLMREMDEYLYVLKRMIYKAEYL